ncbi:MAG: sigma-70 family RNA polymerase sigma factor [Pirellulaceae bacterium]|nr:sigma-70 family RNA polymerase sigma factor [Pirellulaceae bacterium]
MKTSSVHREEAKRIPDLDDCQGFLLAFVNSRLPSRLRRYLGASDIVQSVLITANQRQTHFRGATEAEFQAWLIKIAQGKIVDGMRKYRSRNIYLPDHWFSSCISDKTPEHLDTPSAEVVMHEQAAELLRAIEQLPADVRQVISHRYVDAMTFEQISERMNLPVSTCRRRWLEGCQLLKQRLSHTLP